MEPHWQAGAGCEFTRAPFPVSGPLLTAERFIMQGILTIIIALVAYVTIVNFPESATKTFGLKFLNDSEAKWIIARINQDRADVEAEE